MVIIMLRMISIIFWPKKDERQTRHGDSGMSAGPGTEGSRAGLNIHCFPFVPALRLISMLSDAFPCRPQNALCSSGAGLFAQRGLPFAFRCQPQDALRSSGAGPRAQQGLPGSFLWRPQSTLCSSGAGLCAQWDLKEQ